MWRLGLSDEMRADFTVMKDLSAHTRISPKDRSNQLNKFINNINRYYIFLKI